jgi:hypothetical protein
MIFTNFIGKSVETVSLLIELIKIIYFDELGIDKALVLAKNYYSDYYNTYLEI